MCALIPIVSLLMDWDDEHFSREEFTSHYDALGILENHDIADLLTRSTENTRTGNEFSFKLCALTIGVMVGRQFYCGFDADVDSHGVNIQSKKRKTIPSSFWMRFYEQVRKCYNKCRDCCFL